jgi:hypothetical protein
MEWLCAGLEISIQMLAGLLSCFALFVHSNIIVSELSAYEKIQFFKVVVVTGIK